MVSVLLESTLIVSVIKLLSTFFVDSVEKLFCLFVSYFFLAGNLTEPAVG